MNVFDSSLYENVTPILRQNNAHFKYQPIELIVSDILKVIAVSGPVTYCPFCVSSFLDKSTLEKHLCAAHLAFLWELTSRSISLDVCPFCSAKLVGQHLVAKHSLMYHGNILVDTFFKKQSGLANCLFCLASVDSRCMASHLEEFHALQYNDWFKAKFPLRSGGITGLVDVPGSHGNTEARVTDVEELNQQLKTLNVMSSPKSILKSPVRNPSKGPKLPVRRVLRFEEGHEKNITPKAETKRKDTRSRSFSASSWNTAIRTCCFQCGKCSLSFSSHSQLVLHVKKGHRQLSLNLLQPFFKCGICGARFYKSSYLKKHSAFHSVSKMR